MPRVAFGFAKILMSDPHDFGHVPETIVRSIQDHKIVSQTEGSTVFFLDPELRESDHGRMAVLWLAYASGKTFRAPDPKTGDLREHQYGAHPFQSKALILAFDSGDMVFEVKSSQVRPDAVVDALDGKLRQHGPFHSAFNIDRRQFVSSRDMFIRAIDRYQVVDTVAIRNLRKSNPRPRSAHYDEIADQRISAVRYQAVAPDGIDVEHQGFQDFIDHAASYADFEEVAGLTEGSHERLVAEDQYVSVAADLPSKSDDDRIAAASGVYRRYGPDLS